MLGNMINVCCKKAEELLIVPVDILGNEDAKQLCMF